MNEDVINCIISYLILCKNCNKYMIRSHGTCCRECKTYFCQECKENLKRCDARDEVISFYCKLCVKY